MSTGYIRPLFSCENNAISVVSGSCKNHTWYNIYKKAKLQWFLAFSFFRKKQKPLYELSMKAKQIWEKLRIQKSRLSYNERVALVEELMSLVSENNKKVYTRINIQEHWYFIHRVLIVKNV